MIDIISITALILSVIGAMGHCIKDAHIQKIKCFGIESDCIERKKSKSSLTPPETPTEINI